MTRCGKCGSVDITTLATMDMDELGDIHVFQCEDCGFEWDDEITDLDESEAP